MVEGGARLSNVDQATVKHGLVTPLGSYSALSVAGHVLLGGTGFLTRCYGTAADNVIEYGKHCKMMVLVKKLKKLNWCNVYC